MLIQNKEQVSVNAKEVVLFAHVKAGKTVALSGLPDNLIIDTEDGTGYVTGTVVNVLRIAAERLGCAPKEVMDNPKGPETVIMVLQEVAVEAKNHKFKYVSIDTLTGLIPIATYLGTMIYRNLPIGKNYTGNDVVRDLASGAGYDFLRQGFQKILSLFRPIASECLILVGHVKDASIQKEGRDIAARDISLPGKLKTIICANADAIGQIYRKNGNQTILSFKSDERDLATGARPAHLANQEFVLVEENPKGSRQFEYHWDKVFLQ